jgi:hypothetical protein
MLALHDALPPAMRAGGVQVWGLMGTPLMLWALR